MQKHEVVVTPLQFDNQNKINYLIGSKNISAKPLIPYDNLVCEFLHYLSTSIMKNKR